MRSTGLLLSLLLVGCGSQITRPNTPGPIEEPIADAGSNPRGHADGGVTNPDAGAAPADAGDSPDGGALPACGNGEIEAGESCDDGNQDDGDECTNACQDARCGDGVVWRGNETCDDSNASQLDGCLNDCQTARCGDGFVWVGVEDCDDGNDLQSDGCLNDCVGARCGDGVVRNGVEDCDDGNGLNNDACDNNCELTGPGRAPNNAVASCSWLKENDPLAPSGLYYVGPGNVNPVRVFCEMDYAGGGWTVMAYLRDPEQWDWNPFSDNGELGDTVNGFNSGATLLTLGHSLRERLIVYRRLVERGRAAGLHPREGGDGDYVDLGSQWMINTRQQGLTPYGQIAVGTGWSYRDSYGNENFLAGNLCQGWGMEDRCSSYRGLGMFHILRFGMQEREEDPQNLRHCGLSGGDHGCRDGNSICWDARNDQCGGAGVGDRRCAYLTGPGEGVIYAYR